MKRVHIFEDPMFWLSSMALILLFVPLGAEAQVTASEHAFDLAAPDSNKYNLDMSQDGILPGNFLYCRWGTLMDKRGAKELLKILEFDYLTRAPYTQENEDIAILNSTDATDKFLFSSFPIVGERWQTPSLVGFAKRCR